jgi:hypothetical protein
MGRRVQFVIAGKAHPKDIPGKELIRSSIHFTRDHGLSRSIVFVQSSGAFSADFVPALRLQQPLRSQAHPLGRLRTGAYRYPVTLLASAILLAHTKS